MKRTLLLGGTIGILLTASLFSDTPSAETQAIIAAIDGFHDALHRGDAKAAVELLAPDAIILESGGSETRGKYERHHLTADIAFAEAVSTKTSTPAAHIEGSVAWVSSTSQSTGSVNGRNMDSTGAELIVLTNTSGGWRIRAVHWSSHTAIKMGWA